MASPLILVVGSGLYKASAADLLRKLYGEMVIIETEDINVSGDRRIDAIRWISWNSLRRLDGEYVKVICCLDADDRNDKSWVDMMRFVFDQHSHSVAVVLKNNEIRSKYELLGEPGSAIVLENLKDVANCNKRLQSVVNNLEPFKISAETVKNKEIKAWTNEKVILFGRTGSGKSTIAQMLTRGRLDSGSIFKASSSAKGVTSKIVRDEGRGWHVTDTPGFGEAKGGTVTTKEATDIIKHFVIKICGSYSHYIYALKRGRLDVYDEKLWNFFNKVFAEAETNFSVVVTGCDKRVSAEDESRLQNTFKGCKNFFFVDFCAIEDGDQELEKENETARSKSLLGLENGLAKMGVKSQFCSEGLFSSESLDGVKGGLRSSITYSPVSMGATLDGIVVGAVNQLIFKPVAAVGRYFHKSEIDESFILLPQ
jgi:GTP-binding protein EngB required for normal cell division